MACAKVSAPAASRLSCKGSPPIIALPRFSNASLRAVAKGIAGGLPSPSSQRLPRMVMRCTHCFAPFGCTRRKRPCPSKCLPGSVTVSTNRAVSAFSGFRIPLSAILASPCPSPTLAGIIPEYAGSHGTMKAPMCLDSLAYLDAIGSRWKCLWLPVSPPLALAKPFSPFSFGRIYPLFSGVMQVELSTDCRATWPARGL